MPFNENEYHQNLNFAFKTSAVNTIQIAIRAFNAFWIENQNFLFGADDLYGRLLSFAVNRQFLKSSATTANNYLVSNSIVNAYKGKAVFLNTSDYIVSVCRTSKPRALPGKAAYKCRLAMGNRDCDTQLELFKSDKNQELQVGTPKKYAVLGYRYYNGELEHLNILIPDWKFENVLYSDNLLSQINEFSNYSPEELVEAEVTSLKEDIAKKVQSQKIM